MNSNNETISGTVKRTFTFGKTRKSVFGVIELLTGETLAVVAFDAKPTVTLHSSKEGEYVYLTGRNETNPSNGMPRFVARLATTADQFIAEAERKAERKAVFTHPAMEPDYVPNW